MTKNDPRSGEDWRRHMLAQAERELVRCGEDLDRAIEDIRAGRFGQSKELAGMVSALRKALEAVFNERNRLERLSADIGGTGGDGLDLGAARDEVARRLDRLRAAVDEGGVRGGSQ